MQMCFSTKYIMDLGARRLSTCSAASHMVLCSSCGGLLRRPPRLRIASHMACTSYRFYPWRTFVAVLLAHYKFCKNFFNGMRQCVVFVCNGIASIMGSQGYAYLVINIAPFGMVIYLVYSCLASLHK